jgi:8-oxo-dGTP pyrophosphatase MutT (NUDIX family)
VPEELARGELREETGLTADSMTQLASVWIAYGVMRQLHHVFLAEGLHKGETDPDPEEHDLTLHRVRVEDFEAMLLDGRVMDNCTAAAWGIYLVWKRKFVRG